MQEHPNQLFTEYATQVLSSIGSEANVEPNVEVSANQIDKLKQGGLESGGKDNIKQTNELLLRAL